MTTAETLLLDYDIEISNTRRTLERVPADKPGWVPHAKSMPLGKLAMHCATMTIFGLYIVEDPGMDMATSTRPKQSYEFTTVEAALAELDRTAALSRAALASASDDHLAQPWKFSFGDHVISNLSRALTFRYMCMNHLIHHTAQLGVYLRMLDIPVPALYGPSADEQWVAK
jgi:uncharacterized damage-inducible protein DinB